MRSSVKTHVGILLRKDWYTLKRSWSYLLSFVGGSDLLVRRLDPQGWFCSNGGQVSEGVP